MYFTEMLGFKQTYRKVESTLEIMDYFLILFHIILFCFDYSIKSILLDSIQNTHKKIVERKCKKNKYANQILLNLFEN